jgi:cyclopropane-fatty-acyl-phospholipid synthase
MPPISRSSPFERWLLQRVLSATGQAAIQFVLKGRETVVPTGSSPVARLVIRDLPTLFKMAVNPEIGFGDGYADGNLEVEGDLVAALEAVYRSWPSFRPDAWLTRGKAEWLERLKANTPRRSRDNVHHHYDLNADFYQRWLDREMLYTCAYFPTPSSTLEEAQIAKMDYVCRKVQLQPGEAVVEAGCGWGALALHMARQYGVRVKAFNLSHEQIVFARQRARNEGLGDRVEFIEDDYRNITGRFDVFMSVGMLEHVGLHNYAELGRVIHQSIGNSGRGLLHFIGRNWPAPLSAWIRKRIFPGAYAPALRQALEIFEPWDFSVYDVENLRLHYAKTLEHWLDRFERCAPEISRKFDPKFVRAWRLYLAGSLVAFRVGTMQLFQVTFAGSECQRIPWTREHLYEAQRSQAQGTKWMHAMS